MKKNIPLLLIALFFCFSCAKNRFTTSPSDRLSYSTDTLSFDTVFTTIGSATQQIMVYNTHKNKILIDKIEISAASKFQLAIDGYSGNRLPDIEFRAKDSLYIHVQVKIDPQDRNNPILVKDSIAIHYNKRVDYVHLIAYGQDVFICRKLELDHDSTFSVEKPYLVFDTLKVNSGSTLTLHPGTRICFHNKAGLFVEGRLQAAGTLKNPVVMTGDRFDNIFGDVSYNDLSSQWDGVSFGAESENNELEYVHIRNANYGLKYDSVKNKTATHLTLKNSRIHNMYYSCIYAVDATIRAGNSEITNGRDYCLYLVGGDSEFTHCTIADYYYEPHSKSTQSAAMMPLYLSNKLNGNTHPVAKASFHNSILYGLNSESIKKNKDEAAPFSVTFANCLLRAKEVPEGSEYVEVLWNQEPKFLVKRDEYQFNFKIEPGSPVINKGNGSYASGYPNDIDNINRLADAAPDLGAHEWIPE